MQLVTEEKHESDNLLIRNELGELEEVWNRKQGFSNKTLFDKTVKELDYVQRVFVLWFVE